MCSKLTTKKAPDVVLVFLLLTLNIFDTLFYGGFFGFFLLTLNMQNGIWNILCLNLNLSVSELDLGALRHI